MYLHIHIFSKVGLGQREHKELITLKKLKIK